MHLGKYNKIILSPEEYKFIRDNYQYMTNLQLAKALGLKLTKLRAFIYEMGLKRQEMEYWTKEQTTFLINNYKEIGDTELAEIFEIKWQKNKGWSKKHIEKKRRYLKLKRSKENIAAIRHRNTLMGRFAMCPQKRLKTIGVTPEGEKRVWHHINDSPFVVIKTKKGFEYYSRWLWKKHFGPIPKGMNVRIMSEDKINFTEKDLLLITNAENSVMNTKNRLPKELRETLQLVNKLNRLITKKQAS